MNVMETTFTNHPQRSSKKVSFSDIIQIDLRSRWQMEANCFDENNQTIQLQGKMVRKDMTQITIYFEYFIRYDDDNKNSRIHRDGQES